MKITSAEHVASAVKRRDYPEEAFPEIAFAGRSNVGKSSLINTLVNRKHLVRTSTSPGRTQTINFFCINKVLTFVDLPGYGFARVPLGVKARWKDMVENYLRYRRTLKLVVILLDIRRKPGMDDISLMEWLERAAIPFLIVLTKTDKLSRSKCSAQQKVIQGLLLPRKEKTILFSALTRRGRLEVLQEITSAIRGSEDHRI